VFGPLRQRLAGGHCSRCPPTPRNRCARGSRLRPCPRRGALALLYGAAVLLGPRRTPRTGCLRAETSVIEEAELFYCSTTRAATASFSRDAADAQGSGPGAAAMAGWSFPLLPAPLRRAGRAPSWRAAGSAGFWLQERENDTIAARSRPSTCVGTGSRPMLGPGDFPKAAGAAFSWAGLVALSCVLTGMHSILDVVGARCVRGFTGDPDLGGAAPRRGAVANRWTSGGSARCGSSATALGCPREYGRAVDSSLRWPARPAGPVYATATAGLLGAFLWRGYSSGPQGQMRPFGFYGGMFGICWPHRRRFFGVARRDACSCSRVLRCGALLKRSARALASCRAAATRAPRMWESATTSAFGASRRRGSRAFRASDAALPPSSERHRGLVVMRLWWLNAGPGACAARG